MTSRMLAALALIACCNLVSAAEPSRSDVEAQVVNFYKALALFDVAPVTTPQFEIIDNNGKMTMRWDLPGFAKHLDVARGASLDLRFTLSQFNTVVTPAVAYTTFIEHREKTGEDLYGGATLRRVGKKWLVDRLFSMPIVKPDSAH